MILTNLLFVIACSFLLGLQKLLYGNLRPIEIEQLYEKAWFAVTETCLAMTVFRGEIGLTFLAMFFSLLTGKVWGWIGEGRVEVLEQQPPRNPRLFHTRLALSLGLSVAFDLTMLEYVVKQVMRMARPDMMVMFGFEFAVLSVMSISTAVRYAIDLAEIGIIREQKRRRIEEIKRERAQAALSEFQESQSSNAPTADATPSPTQLTLDQVSQDAFNQPVDENEVEVEGWEDKGRYMFYLNLATDFFKLVIYLAFFFILLVFYGLPIHILRDVFLTMRSFLKRISDFMKYRTATRDMNARYPDATAEDIGREDVCIICREEMHPYQPPIAAEGQPPPRQNPVAERMRPKKLPCGHVLHFSCLRSWLERQQICPTCRANVVRTGAQDANAGQAGAAQGNGGQHRPGARQGPRVYQFGPLRIGVGAARGNDMFEELRQQLGDRPGALPPPVNGDANAPRQFGVGVRWSGMRRRRTEEPSLTTPQQIDALETQIRQETEELARSSAELGVLRSMQAELQRLRTLRPGENQPQTNATPQSAPASGLPPLPRPIRRPITLVTDGQRNVIQAGSDRLPAGLTLPEGWTMMPLQPAPNHQHDIPVPPPQGVMNPPIFGTIPFTFPPNMHQLPFNTFPQAPPTNHRPHRNEQNGAPQTNGDQSAPPAQQTAAQADASYHAFGHAFTPLSHAQLHEQWLASLRNQNHQANAPSAAHTSAPNANGTTSQTVPADADGSDPAEAMARHEHPLAADDAQATVSIGPSLPSLPSWGSSAPTTNNGEGSSAAPQVNGDHNEESHEDSSPSQRPSESKDCHATVEDLVEDPD